MIEKMKNNYRALDVKRKRFVIAGLLGALLIGGAACIFDGDEGHDEREGRYEENGYGEGNMEGAKEDPFMSFVQLTVVVSGTVILASFIQPKKGEVVRPVVLGAKRKKVNNMEAVECKTEDKN